jgi:hypothetical protein
MQNNGRGAYSTHRFVLMGLSSWLSSRNQSVKKVLELGCGPISTQLFLNRAAFPQLVELHSFESNKEWADAITLLFGGDKRLLSRFHPEEESLLHDASSFAPYDIVLVDGPTNAHRLLAIPKCLEMARFVVVHDTQEKELEGVRKMAPYSFTSVIESPWTTVLSDHEAPFGYSPVIGGSNS